jgi:hypothetical protein
MAYTCTASLITITDEVNVTCQSICDACAQMTKAGTLQFISTANWRFVNSHFKDTNKQIHFNITSGYIYVDTNSSFQLGEIDGNGNVYDGCALKFNSCQTDFWSTDGGAGDIKLYDSLIDTPEAFFRTYKGTIQVIEMIGCIIQHWYGGRFQGENESCKLKNLYIHGGANFSFGPKGAGQIFDNILVTRSTYGIYYSSPAGGEVDGTMHNITARNNNFLAFIVTGTSGDLYLVNPDSDVWNFNWSGTAATKVYRQYTFNLNVLDTNQNNVENATAILKDKDGTQIFSLTTNANGEITEQTVSYGYYNQANENTLQSYSPHTLEIRKAGYKTYKKKFTADGKIDWTIALQRIAINIDMEVIA